MGSIAKGEAFAAGFEQLWEALVKLDNLGVPNIQSKMNDVFSRVVDRVRAGIKSKLADTLAERCHAETRTWDSSELGGIAEEEDATLVQRLKSHNNVAEKDDTTPIQRLRSRAQSLKNPL